MNRRLLVTFVQDVLADRRPLQDLQELILEVLWDGRGQEAADVSEMAESLDARIAEFTGGYIPFDALKDELRRVSGLNVPILTIDDHQEDEVRWESSSRTLRKSAAFA